MVSGVYRVVILGVTTIPYSLFSGISLGFIAEYAVNRQIWFRKGAFKIIVFFFTGLKLMSQNFIHQLLVAGSLFQVVACLVQYLQLSFPIFALSFGLAGIGMSFQVCIMKK